MFEKKEAAVDTEVTSIAEIAREKVAPRRAGISSWSVPVASSLQTLW